jgi:hypothetical protein
VLDAVAVARWAAVLLLVLGSVMGSAQSTDEQQRFDVASILVHVDTGDTQAGIEVSEGFVRIRNLSLRAVIGIAYGSYGANGNAMRRSHNRKRFARTSSRTHADCRVDGLRA